MGDLLFVTGTDTGVGKTRVAAGLVRVLRTRGYAVCGLKPIASGAERTPQGLRNDDALALAAETSRPLPYEVVNPWCFEPAIAPHIAAADAGVALPLDALRAWLEQTAAGFDVSIVEGAGGWRLPLYPNGFLSDLAEAMTMPVFMVVGLRLGCLNHALLTCEAIERSGRCRLAGWAANLIDPHFARPAENLRTLERRLGPPLAVFEHFANPDVAEFAARLDRPGLAERLGLGPSPPSEVLPG